MKPYKEIKPFNLRQKPRFKYPDGRVCEGEILDEIEIEHKGSGPGNKFYKYLVQQIEWKEEVPRIEFRICYYYNDFDDNNFGWIFGQFALSLSPEDWMYFHKKMKDKGWI